MTSTADPVTLVRQKYEGLRRDMIRWRDATNLYSRAHKKRWNQALAALGEITGEQALTSLEAQAFADRGWKRWDRVVIAIREMELARANEKQQKPKFEGSRRAPTPTDTSVSSATSRNAPDYKADYRAACKTINELRIEVGSLKQSLNTVKQRLESAEAYGGRQHARAERAEAKLKEAGTISDKEYQRVVEDYEEMRDLYNKQKNELHALQDGKITFPQAVKAIMDDDVINMEIPIEGAKHLTPDDRRILRDHIIDIDNAMEDINTWLWDVNSVPPGLIGKNYVGKNHNLDMADMLKTIDHITHQAWQTMQVVRTLGRKMEAAK